MIQKMKKLMVFLGTKQGRIIGSIVAIIVALICDKYIAACRHSDSLDIIAGVIFLSALVRPANKKTVVSPKLACRASRQKSLSIGDSSDFYDPELPAFLQRR
jgi:hypothetical protein